MKTHESDDSLAKRDSSMLQKRCNIRFHKKLIDEKNRS